MTEKRPQSRIEPRVPITSPAFRYTTAAATDIRATFARYRKEVEDKRFLDELMGPANEQRG